LYFDGGSQLPQQIFWNKFHIRCAYFTPNCTWSLNYSVLVLYCYPQKSQKIPEQSKRKSHLDRSRTKTAVFGFIPDPDPDGSQNICGGCLSQEPIFYLTSQAPGARFTNV
jgi:hypothetical protein